MRYRVGQPNGQVFRDVFNGLFHLDPKHILCSVMLRAAKPHDSPRDGFKKNVKVLWSSSIIPRQCLGWRGNEPVSRRLEWFPCQDRTGSSAKISFPFHQTEGRCVLTVKPARGQSRGWSGDPLQPDCHLLQLVCSFTSEAKNPSNDSTKSSSGFCRRLSNTNRAASDCERTLDIQHIAFFCQMPSANSTSTGTEGWDGSREAFL